MASVRARLGADRSAVVFVGALVVGFVVLEWYARYFWFFGDEFAFLVSHRLRDVPDAGAFVHELLVPHNEHLSILPKVWYGLADTIWGLRTYRPYVTAAILVHLFTVTMAWLLMRRAGVDRWIAVGAAALLILFGPGWENLFWGFQVGFMGSVGLGLAAILCATGATRSVWRDAATAVLAGLALATAGPAIAVVIGLAFVLLVRRGVRAAVLILIAPVLLYAIWFKWFPAPSNIPHSGPADIYSYALAQITRSLEAIIGLPGIGSVAFIGLLAFLAWHWRSSFREQRIDLLYGLVISSAAFAVLTGYGRAALGIDQASGSRYLYIQAVFLVPVIAYALTRVPQGEGRRRAFACVFVGVALVSAFVALRAGVRDRSTLVLSIRDQLLTASADPLILSSVAPDVLVNAQFAPDVSVGGLRHLREAGELPAWPVSVQVRDGMRAQLAAAASSPPASGWVPDGHIDVLKAVGANITPADNRCVTAAPTSSRGEVAVSVGSGQTLVISGDQVGTAGVGASLVVDGTALPVQLPAPGTQAITLRFPGELRLQLGNAPVLICPVQSPTA